MIRQPPRSTRTDTLFPYTPLFRSDVLPDAGARARERLGKRAELIGDLARRCQKGVTRRAGRRIGRKVLRGVVEARKLPAQSLGIIVEIGLDLIEPALPFGRTRIITRRRPGIVRSEERRVGNECVSPCRSRGSPCH